jgi:chorismate mutase
MDLNLDEIRDELDSLNHQIVDVIEERMDLIVKVAEYKDKNDIEIVDEEREEEVKQEFERIFQERDLPDGRGRELAEYLIATAIDLEEDILDREINRN